MKQLSSDALAALRAHTGERVFLVRMEFSGDVLYFTTGSRDLDWTSPEWGAQTWIAAGGHLDIGAIEESADARAGMEIGLSGVDQSVVAVLLTQQYRGRSIWVGHAILDAASGAVLDVIEIFDGKQLDQYEVEEQSGRGKAGTVTIKTTARHRLMVDEFRGICANVHAHQKYYPGDTFFQHVGKAPEKIYWGTAAPFTPAGNLIFQQLQESQNKNKRGG